MDPAGLHQPGRVAPLHAGLHRVLQPSPLSRSHRQRDPGRCLLRTAERILRRSAEQKQRTIEQRLRYSLSRWNQKLTGELNPKV